MVLQIRDREMVVSRALELRDHDLAYLETTAGFGSPVYIRFDEIDLVLLSADNLLSVHTARVVYRIRINPDLLEHWELIETLQQRLEQPPEQLGVAPLSAQPMRGQAFRSLLVPAAALALLILLDLVLALIPATVQTFFLVWWLFIVLQQIAPMLLFAVAMASAGVWFWDRTRLGRWLYVVSWIAVGYFLVSAATDILALAGVLFKGGEHGLVTVVVALLTDAMLAGGFWLLGRRVAALREEADPEAPGWGVKDSLITIMGGEQSDQTRSAFSSWLVGFHLSLLIVTMTELLRLKVDFRTGLLQSQMHWVSYLVAPAHLVVLALLMCAVIAGLLRATAGSAKTAQMWTQMLHVGTCIYAVLFVLHAINLPLWIDRGRFSHLHMVMTDLMLVLLWATWAAFWQLAARINMKIKPAHHDDRLQKLIGGGWMSVDGDLAQLSALSGRAHIVFYLMITILLITQLRRATGIFTSGVRTMPLFLSDVSPVFIVMGCELVAVVLVLLAIIRGYIMLGKPPLLRLQYWRTTLVRLAIVWGMLVAIRIAFVVELLLSSGISRADIIKRAYVVIILLDVGKAAFCIAWQRLWARGWVVALEEPCTTSPPVADPSTEK